MTLAATSEYSESAQTLRPMGLSRSTMAKHQQSEVLDGIFERGEADTELARRCSALELELKEKDAQLQEALKNHDKCKAELQQFTRKVSHDLQTPLRAIEGFSNFLKQEYQAQLDSTANDYIQRVVEGARHLNRLLSGLVRFSRIESQALEHKQISLEQAVDDALASMQEQIDERETEIHCEGMPKVWGDHGQLIELFQCLIGNALKFNHADIPEIRISAQQIGPEWVIQIRDNGIGIAKKFYACVFDMFRRLHAHEQYEGIGAGLPICRKIAEQHGWSMSLDSEVGVGTTVHIRGVRETLVSA